MGGRLDGCLDGVLNGPAAGCLTDWATAWVEGSVTTGRLTDLMSNWAIDFLTD